MKKAHRAESMDTYTDPYFRNAIEAVRALITTEDGE